MQVSGRGKEKIGEYKGMIFIAMIMIIHLVLTFWIQTHASVTGDGIFTYTLANNPYSFEYIDPAYKRLPQSNGWINAHILRESYIVEEYDDFNYSSVYFHQRIDNHPLLYYSIVHTVCSLFTDTYSNLYTMIINLIFLCAVDILMIKLFKKLYGKVGYSTVPFTFLFLTIVMQRLYVLPRMYMALAFFCFWYLYMHWDLLTNEKWKKSYLIKMTACVLLGTQTHYYFYVYAFALTGYTIIYLLYKHRNYNMFCYVYSGVVGIALSWIVFPWIIWHIFFNQMSKHTEVTPWSFSKLKEYIMFLNDQLLNGRGIIAILILVILCIVSIVFRKNRQPQKADVVRFRRIVFGSGFIYSLIIFTLDDGVWYYSTPLFLTFILWFSMVLLGGIKRIPVKKKSDILVISLAVCCVVGILTISKTVENIAGYLEEDRINVNLRKVAQEYQQYDCIFIEHYQNNLLQGFWFEFGEYDEFKKIPLDEFEKNGIQEEDLEGRKDDSGLIVYAPMEYVKGHEYQLLAIKGYYGVYKVDVE